MADLALVTANRVSVVEAIGHGRQRTLPAGVAITAGQPVIIDPTTGKWALARGTTAPLARIYGVAARTVAAGEALTAIRLGTLDGYDLSAMAYDAPVYLSDTLGTLGTTAGTVSTVVGRVVPATATSLGTAFDKLLEVDL